MRVLLGLGLCLLSACQSVPRQTGQVISPALAVMAAQLAFANVWLLFFQAGPVEWVWKSLAYRKAQPFRKPAGAAAFAAAE